MGFSYRKAVKLPGGLRLNMSKRGPSLSAGAGRLRYSTRNGPRITLPGGITWRGKRPR